MRICLTQSTISRVYLIPTATMLTMITSTKRFAVLFCLFLCATTIRAELSVVDETGREVRLANPARRIISLAPHVTELLFAAGAGERVIGVVSYSDYPEAALKLPQVGGYHNLDLEKIVGLKPDLIVAWSSGNRQTHLEKLEALGIPVYLTEPRTLSDIAHSIEMLGRLAGSENIAMQEAEAFRTRLRTLQERFSNRPSVRMMYQIWDQPLRTINGQHLISDVINLCGGKNIFSDLPQLAPVIGVESVLAADPEAIVASGMGEARPDWLDRWRAWPNLQATKMGNLFFIPPQLVQRHTPRILDGATQLCDFLENARAKRPSLP